MWDAYFTIFFRTVNVYYQSLKINIINLINNVDYFYYVSSHIDQDNVDILNKPPRLNKGNIVTFYDDVRKKLSKKNIDVNLKGNLNELYPF